MHLPLLNQICLSALAPDNPAERWADPGDLEVALALISTESNLKSLMDGICAIHDNAACRHWRSEAETYLLRTADLQRHQDNAAFAAALNKAACSNSTKGFLPVQGRDCPRALPLLGGCRNKPFDKLGSSLVPKTAGSGRPLA
ncbi:MAG: hypothetical protein NTY67_12885 [Cyanobacteria bacterium]|nr:hypothetical protein [Cyanobacteriota bacterium]